MALADAARDAGRYDEAAELYGAMVRRFPKDAGLLVLRGNMLKDGGRLAEARQVYDAAVARRPDDADLHLQRGHLAKLEGRWDEAIACYRRSAELDPSRSEALEEIRQAELRPKPRQIAEGTVDPTVLTSADGGDLIALRLQSAFAHRPR